MKALFRFGVAAPLVMLFALLPLRGEIAPATALEQMVATATQQMEQNQWLEAQQQWREIITHFGDAASSHIGPRFGAVWYQLGRCHLMLHQPKEAMEAFATCFRDYPNRDGDSSNPFQWLALQLWAETAQATEQHELALQLYNSLQRQQLKDTSLSLSAWHLNVAHCHFMLNHSSEGLENFEIALINRDGFATPPAGIASGLRDLASMCLRLKNENLLIDFLRKHHALLAQIMAENPGLTHELLRIATLLQPAQWWQSSLWTLSLCPPPQSLAATSPDIAVVRQGELTLHLTQALVHEQLGNRAIALTLYDSLLAQHADVPQRSTWRLSALRLARELDDSESLKTHTLAQFQQAPQAGENGQILNDWLQHLFSHGQYQECLKQADQWRGVAASHEAQAAIRLRLRLLCHLLTGELAQAASLLRDPIAQSSWPIDGEREWLEIMLSPHVAGGSGSLAEFGVQSVQWAEKHAAQCSPLQLAAVLQLRCWIHLRLQQPLQASAVLQQLVALPANELQAPARDLLQWLQFASGELSQAQPFQHQSIPSDHLYLTIIAACVMPFQDSLQANPQAVGPTLTLSSLRLQMLYEHEQRGDRLSMQKVAGLMLQQSDLTPEERQAAEKALKAEPSTPAPASP